MHAYYKYSMISKDDDLLGTLVHDVAHLLRHDIDRRVAALNLTRSKWLAMGMIHRNPGLSQADLSAKLELGAAAVGRLVDRLVDRSFVERSPSPHDRRAHVLSLTADAEALITQLDEIGGALREELLEGLSDKEVGLLNRGLNKLKANLQKAGACAMSLFPLRAETVTELHTGLQLAIIV